MHYDYMSGLAPLGVEEEIAAIIENIAAPGDKAKALSAYRANKRRCVISLYKAAMQELALGLGDSIPEVSVGDMEAKARSRLCEELRIRELARIEKMAKPIWYFRQGTGWESAIQDPGPTNRNPYDGPMSIPGPEIEEEYRGLEARLKAFKPAPDALVQTAQEILEECVAQGSESGSQERIRVPSLDKLVGNRRVLERIEAAVSDKLQALKVVPKIKSSKIAGVEKVEKKRRVRDNRIPLDMSQASFKVLLMALVKNNVIEEFDEENFNRVILPHFRLKGMISSLAIAESAVAVSEKILWRYNKNKILAFAEALCLEGFMDPNDATSAPSKFSYAFKAVDGDLSRKNLSSMKDKESDSSFQAKVQLFRDMLRPWLRRIEAANGR